ncbi:MAG: sulfotransferase domain-containing protein [Ignavibacteriales bacterium]|nr:sulfotransferase domain-containing protein [Ignavibacteriales bacterium]
MSIKKNPLMIIGAHRSGTTFTGNMVSLSNEVAYIRDPFAKYRLAGLFQLKPDNFFTYINSDNSQKFVDRFSKIVNFNYSILEEFSNMKNLKDVKSLLKDVLRFEVAKRKNKRPLLKAATAIFSAEWLDKEFGFRVLALIRHPAAFISSLKRLNITHPFQDFLNQQKLMEDYLKDFECQIIEYSQLQKKHSSQNVPDIIDQGILLWNIIYSTVIKLKQRNPHWLFLKHEDISKEPTRYFKQIYDHFELSFTNEIEEKIVSYTSTLNPSEAKSGEWNSLKRDSASNVKNWKTRLTLEEIERIKLNTKKFADRFYSEEDW